MEDGVWRTVGGRRIFIKDGEDLASAMKKSGKFKSNKKKQEEHYAGEELYSDNPNRFGNKLKEYNDKMSKEQDESAKRVNERYEKELKEKYMNIPEEERVKAYEEGKDWKDLVKEKENKSTNETMNDAIREKAKKAKDAEAKFFKGSSKEEKENYLKAVSNATEAKTGIENAGVKIKETIGSNDFGQGKSVRFLLEDGGVIEHVTNSLGHEVDRWEINKVVNGSLEGPTFNSYDEMIKYINKNKSSKYGIHTDAYKKAYQTYMSEHPDSEMSLDDFVKRNK